MAGKINLTDELKKYFGFNKFKGNQEAIIQNLLDGKDTFVLMPTGGGKSLCYQLPSLLMEGTAIVISPLIALMKNQVDAMRNFSEEDGIAHFINSSLNKGAIDQVRSDILAGKTKLLYVAPESLTKEENVDFLRSVKISFYAVDEAHCISEWGHDFRPEYRRIRPIINEIGKAPLIALTATATPKVQHDIQKNLGMVDAQVFKSSFNRPNLYYEVRAKTNNIDKDIIKFIKNNSEKSGIIYCLSRKKVEELAEILQANGINARPYHAGMDSMTRTKNQDDFQLIANHPGFYLTFVSCLDFYLARKRIAETAVGFNPQRRVRIGFELVSQVADVDVDDAARAQDVIAPNALKQLFAAQNLTAVLGQVVQQFEFFWRQLKIFSVLDGAKRIEAQRDAV